MGNRVYLELRGSDPAMLVEESNESVASLAANNSLPLFWLALLREENLDVAWESGVHDAFVDPEGGGMEPICLGWREARANLASARGMAEVRLPNLFSQLRDWEAGLVTLSNEGPAREVRLCLAEHANFYDSPDGFVRRLREIVQLWHGADPPASPPVVDAGSDLTGFVWLTDEPFPAALPTWKLGCPEPGMPAMSPDIPVPVRTLGWVVEWSMVLFFSVTVVGSTLFGARHLGSGGMWIGGLGGFLVSVIVVWLWARWSTSR